MNLQIHLTWNIHSFKILLMHYPASLKVYYPESRPQNMNLQEYFLKEEQADLSKGYWPADGLLRRSGDSWNPRQTVIPKSCTECQKFPAALFRIFAVVPGAQGKQPVIPVFKPRNEHKLPGETQRYGFLALRFDSLLSSVAQLFYGIGTSRCTQ